MGFLIDSNLWIAIERERLSAADVHAITGQAPIYLSPVNLAEVFGTLAAQADERKFTLLTENARDFRDLPGLKFVAVNLPPS